MTEEETDESGGDYVPTKDDSVTSEQDVDADIDEEEKADFGKRSPPPPQMLPLKTELKLAHPSPFDVHAPSTMPQSSNSESKQSPIPSSSNSLPSSVPPSFSSESEYTAAIMAWKEKHRMDMEKSRRRSMKQSVKKQKVLTPEQITSVLTAGNPDPSQDPLDAFRKKYSEMPPPFLYVLQDEVDGEKGM